MTISDSFSFNPTADEIIRQALQLSGLVTLGRRPQPAMLADARDMLSTMLKALQAKGTVLTTSERTTLALTSGTATYSLAADTIDVQFPTTLQASGSTSETIIERMSYDDYAPIADKASTGTPTRAMVEKGATLQVTFWNVPNGSYTWKYRRIRLIRDTDSGGVTLDLTRKYLQAIVWKMAHRLALANAVPLTRVQYLEVQALAAQEEATGDDNERGDTNLQLPNVYGR